MVGSSISFQLGPGPASKGVEGGTPASLDPWAWGTPTGRQCYYQPFFIFSQFLVDFLLKILENEYSWKTIRLKVRKYIM